MSLTVQELTLLIARGETQHVEFKGPMAFDGDGRIELTKDIVAMANTRDGGVIILGVETDPSSQKLTSVGLNTAQIKSLDVTRICDFVHARSAPPIKINVSVIHFAENVNLVVIQVPEFDDQPIIFTKTGQTSRGDTVFREASIFVRSAAGSSEPLKDESSMRHLLGMAVRKKGDELLQEISNVLRGYQKPTENLSLRDQWKCEASLTQQHVEEPFIPDRVNWLFSFHPRQRNTKGLVKGHQALKDILKSAIVSLRGWDFPYLNHGLFVNLQTQAPDARDYVVHKPNIRFDADHQERLVFFDTAFFGFSRSAFGLQRNLGPQGDKLISMFDIIFTLGEFFLFMKRVIEQIKSNTEIEYSIKLINIQGKSLWANPVHYMFSHRLSSSECMQSEILISDTVQTHLLNSDHKLMAINAVARVFQLFQFDGEGDEFIEEQLTKLYTRRLD